MATRKSGDGSRMEDGGGDSPGSYAKSNGSRRRRKGKKGRETLPPSGRDSSLPPEVSEQSAEQPIENALDVEGEEVERDGGRLTKPDFGEAPTRDFSVDDLRRKSISSRAPRKQLGPLGMEEAIAAESSQPPHRPSTPRPAPRPSGQGGRLNVVEINSAGQASDNTNSDRFEPAHDPFGDPFEHEPESEPPLPPLHRPSPAALPQRSVRPYEPEEALEQALRDAEGAGRPSMSSVFGARASIRPSPPPPKVSSVSILWWVVVSLLTAIIVTAGVIALREAKQAEQAEQAPVGPDVSEELAAPAPRATPQPASNVQPAQPVGATPPAQPAAVKPAPATKRSAAPTPVAAPLPKVAPALAKAPPAPAAAVPRSPTPVALKPRSQPPRPIQTREIAQEAVAAPAAEPAPTPEPAPAPATTDERLPQNPYN